MAITESQGMRERTVREQIDERLLGAVELARSNRDAALRLRGLLLGAPPEEERGIVPQSEGNPARPARPGWFGEIRDGLEVLNDYMETTAKALQEIYTQAATAMPTANAPKKG